MQWDPVQQFVDHLSDPKGKATARGFRVCCPAHDDNTPSLDIDRGDKGAILQCRSAGCTTQAICDAANWPMPALFHEFTPVLGSGMRGLGSPERARLPARPKTNGGGNGKARPAPIIVPPEEVAWYQYVDLKGELVSTKTRMEPKSFRWSNGNPHVPYFYAGAIEALTAGDNLYLCEGEKAVDRIEADGIPATCGGMGSSGVWDAEWISAFANAWYLPPENQRSEIRAIVDRDEAGDAWALMIEAVFADQGLTVRFFSPVPTDDHADAYDHLERGHDISELIPYAKPGTEEQAAFLRQIQIHHWSQPAPDREWLVDGFIPAGETGLIAGEGGVGKGFLQLRLAFSIALGQTQFGPFTTGEPRGIVLVTREENREEMHRRAQWVLGAMATERGSFGGYAGLIPALLPFVRSVDMKGADVGPDGLAEAGFVQRIQWACEDVSDPGLVIIDPLSRFVPDGMDFNSQTTAVATVNAMDIVGKLTGSAVIGTAHVSQTAAQTTSHTTSSVTGSKQWTDLTRFVVTMEGVDPEKVAEQDWPEGEYVEARLPKANYSRVVGDGEGMFWRRGDHGELLPYAPVFNRTDAILSACAADKQSTMDIAKLIGIGRSGTYKILAQMVADDLLTEFVDGRAHYYLKRIR